MTLSRNQLAAISDYVSSTYGSIYEPDNWLEYWADISEKIEDALGSVSGKPVICIARRQRVADPSDCDWPFCGCDPHADKVIEAIEDSRCAEGDEEIIELMASAILREKQNNRSSFPDNRDLARAAFKAISRKTNSALLEALREVEKEAANATSSTHAVAVSACQRIKDIARVTLNRAARS